MRPQNFKISFTRTRNTDITKIMRINACRNLKIRLKFRKIITRTATVTKVKKL
jgi:hypothetical protein